MLGGGRMSPARKYTAAQNLTSRYVKGYEQRHGEKPAVEPRDGKTLKEMATQFGEELVAQRLDAYLAWDDPFVADAGWPVYLFRRCWNRLAQQVLKTQRQQRGSVARGCQHQPPCSTDAEHTQKRLKDMRGETR